MDRWLEDHSSCPLCRRKVSVEDATLFKYSTSSRFLFPSSRREDSSKDLKLELFVEREPGENSGRHGSSRFSIGRSVLAVNNGKIVFQRVQSSPASQSTEDMNPHGDGRSSSLALVALQQSNGRNVKTAIRSLARRNPSASGLPVRLVELPFPCSEVGLPDGCENLDLILSLDAFKKFFDAAALLLRPPLSYLREVQPRPSCLISDMCHPWTAEIARELRILSLIFHGCSCFALLCCHNIQHNGGA